MLLDIRSVTAVLVDMYMVAEALGSPTSIQIWGTTVCPRLPCEEPWNGIWQSIRREDWKGNDVFISRKVSGTLMMFLRYVNGLCSIIGIGEIVLLPLDVLKIKRQTNPEAFRGRGVVRIVRDEGFGLYRGWGWTAARNAPGSFAVSVLMEAIWVLQLMKV